MTCWILKEKEKKHCVEDRVRSQKSEYEDLQGGYDQNTKHETLKIMNKIFKRRINLLC